MLRRGSFVVQTVRIEVAIRTDGSVLISPLTVRLENGDGLRLDISFAERMARVVRVWAAAAKAETLTPDPCMSHGKEDRIMLTIIIGISEEAQTAALRAGTKTPAVMYYIVVPDPVPVELATEALDLGARALASGDMILTHEVLRERNGRYTRPGGEGLTVIPTDPTGALAAIRTARAAAARQQADKQAKLVAAHRAEAAKRIANVLGGWAIDVEQANAQDYAAWQTWLVRALPRGAEPCDGRLLRALKSEIKAARQQEYEYVDQHRRDALLDWARANLNTATAGRIDDGAIPSAEIIDNIEEYLREILAPLGDSHDDGRIDFDEPLTRYSDATWHTLQGARKVLADVCTGALSGSAKPWRVEYDDGEKVEEVRVTLRHTTTGVEVKVWLRNEKE